jgi:hypothetical protein
MKTKLIDLLGLTNMANDIRDWVNAKFQRKADGKGLSTNDYDNTAKDKVDAIPDNPQYTDTQYTAGDGISIEDNVISATGGGGGGGEENVIESISVNGTAQTVTNKNVDIAVPTKTSDLDNDSGFISTETDPTVPSWAKQQNKPSYNYSEIGNTPDLSGFVTKSVNDLTNYYLKSETYTQAEVNALIGAIQQFHYEIYATLPQTGQSNVLYLIGPTGSGSDRYEEYVYSNNTFTKIGDTSIDLSGYVTTSALNTALQSYTPTSNLATVATSGSYNDLSDKPTIPTIPVQDVTVGGTSVVSNGTAVIPAIPDTSDFEASANKVSTITGNETNTTKYPNTKAVADALGKWGVISQTQTWTQASDGGYDYTMSDLVWGLIPQSSIDLYESAGAVFNATTGYFEMNGITNLSYDDIRLAYKFSYCNGCNWANLDLADGYNIRTTFPLDTGTRVDNTSLAAYRRAINHTLFYWSTMPNLEVLRLTNNESKQLSLSAYSGYLFYNSINPLKKVIGVLNIYNLAAGTPQYFFSSCPNLETLFLNENRRSLDFHRSKSLSLESIVFLVEHSANGTTAITITLHATAYARCQADTTEYTYNSTTYTGILNYASAKNITIASA